MIQFLDTSCAIEPEDIIHYCRGENKFRNPVARWKTFAAGFTNLKPNSYQLCTHATQINEYSCTVVFVAVFKLK